MHIKGTQIFQKPGRHLKILGNIWSKIHTEEPQIFRTTVHRPPAGNIVGALYHKL